MYYCQSLQKKKDVYSTVSNGKVEMDSTCMLNDIVYLGRCKSGTMYFCRHNWAFDKTIHPQIIRACIFDVDFAVERIQHHKGYLIDLTH